MFCPNCGKEMNDGAIFCSNCGWSKGGVSTKIAIILQKFYEH